MTRNDAALGERRRRAVRGEARAQEDGDPRPHRVELPHVPEVPEVRQAHAAVAEDLRDLRRVETGRRGRVRSVADEEEHDGAAGDREARHGEHVDAPRGMPDRVDEIRERLAERDAADEDAEGRSAPAAKPGREDLHAGRIDAGEEEPRQEPQDHGRDRPAREEREPGVRGRAEPRGDGEEAPRREHVRQVAERAHERAGHEPELHRERQPRRRRVRQTPLGLERGRDGGGREPEGHAEQLGQGDEREDAPARGRLHGDGGLHGRRA